MGYLYKQKSRDGTPGRVWWAKYYVDGRPVRESTGTEKEAEAKRFLKLREGAAATGAPIAPKVDRILIRRGGGRSPRALPGHRPVEEPWRPEASADAPRPLLPRPARHQHHARSHPALHH